MFVYAQSTWFDAWVNFFCAGQTAIAVDFDCYERFIYWTDVSEGTISRARADGSDAEILVSGKQFVMTFTAFTIYHSIKTVKHYITLIG